MEVPGSATREKPTNSFKEHLLSSKSEGMPRRRRIIRRLIVAIC